jgi:hypothetical protein
MGMMGEKKKLVEEMTSTRGVSLKETDRRSQQKTLAGESRGLSQEEKSWKRLAARKEFLWAPLPRLVLQVTPPFSVTKTRAKGNIEVHRGTWAYARNMYMQCLLLTMQVMVVVVGSVGCTPSTSAV